MARKSGGKAQGSDAGKPRGKCEDLYRTLKLCVQDQWMKSWGFEALDFGLGIGEILTPKSSIHELQRQSDVRHTFNEWLQSIHDSAINRTVTLRNRTVTSPGNCSIPILQHRFMDDN